MTVQSANGGRRQIVTHRFASTDGAAHDVDAHLSADMDNPPRATTSSSCSGFPTSSSCPPSDAFPAPPGTGTVLFRQNKAVPDGSMEFPIGAVTMSPAPQFIQFKDETPPGEFIMPYRGTVSPGLDLVVYQQFDTEPTLALAQAAGAAARDRLEAPTFRSPPRSTERRP